MRNIRVTIFVALLAVGYFVSYGILSRRESKAIPEDLLPGGYTVFRFPGTMDMNRAPDQLPVNRLQEFDDALRIFYLPLIKLDRRLFKNLHHGEITIEVAHGDHGECLGRISRYRLD